VVFSLGVFGDVYAMFFLLLFRRTQRIGGHREEEMRMYRWRAGQAHYNKNLK
jgi:hypothetical protein